MGERVITGEMLCPMPGTSQPDPRWLAVYAAALATYCARREWGVSPEGDRAWIRLAMEQATAVANAEKEARDG